MYPRQYKECDSILTWLKGEDLILNSDGKFVFTRNINHAQVIEGKNYESKKGKK
jgi:hypothetical protein